MPDTYKLYYFPITALGEPIRFLFAYGSIDFEDSRVEFADWPNMKPTMPFGQMPVLEINNVRYHQSMALVRYLAKKVHLYGKDDLHSLKIDMMADTVNDLRQKIGSWYYQANEEVKSGAKATLFEQTIPDYCSKLDKVVGDNGGYFVDGQLSYADIYFVSLLPYVNFMIEKSLVAGYGNLEKLVVSVESEPKIKQWIEKRPKSDR